MSTPHDPADELENPREHLGDLSQAVQDFSSEQEGYHKSLSSRQLQMIAIGGAIGTGLFLGAGGRLEQGGPLLVLVYAVCGFFAFLVLRALGELVLHRPRPAPSCRTRASSTARRWRTSPAGCTS